MIKGRNQKERLQTWHNHFQCFFVCLRGSPPEIEEVDEPIIQILQPLEIKCGPFFWT